MGNRKLPFSTGHRIQTIINLKVGDVDLDEGYVNVNIQKNTNTRRISIINKLNRILRDYIAFYRCDDEGYPLKMSIYFVIVMESNLRMEV